MDHRSVIPGKGAPIVGRGRKRVNQRERRPADICYRIFAKFFRINIFELLLDPLIIGGVKSAVLALSVSASCTKMGDGVRLSKSVPGCAAPDGPLVVHRDHGHGGMRRTGFTKTLTLSSARVGGLRVELSHYLASSPILAGATNRF